MRVLGFDPAIDHATWAVVEILYWQSPVHAKYVTHGHDAVTFYDMNYVINQSGIDVIAIECPAKAVFQLARVGHLLRTTRASGWLEGACSMVTNADVIRCSANTWRTMLLGKHNPPDAQVKRAIDALVIGLPSRTNDHVRDAIGIAAAVGILASREGAGAARAKVEQMDMTKSERMKLLEASAKRGGPAA